MPKRSIYTTGSSTLMDLIKVHLLVKVLVFDQSEVATQHCERMKEKKENLHNKINSMQAIEVEYYLDLFEDIKKCDTPKDILKSLALETINTRFPKEELLHIFADGSLLSSQKGAGAGATCQLFSFYKSLGYGTTNFGGEVEAIHSTLKSCYIGYLIFKRQLYYVIPEQLLFP